MFNHDAVEEYLVSIREGNPIPLPKIVIELYFKDDPQLARFKGSNNSEEKDCPGVYVEIAFDTQYKQQYDEYIKNPDDIIAIPVEYYEIKWYSFADNVFKFTELPIKSLLLANVENRFVNSVDKYVSEIMDSALTSSESAILSLGYRQLRERFIQDDNIIKINRELDKQKEDITDKELKLSVDISAKTNWDAALTLYADDVPLRYIGKGEQTAIKTKLALQSKLDKANIILIEEPEANLSFSNMNKLIHAITKKCEEKQLIITTHSSFVINKCGLNNVMFMRAQSPTSLGDIPKATYSYFMKLPGYDTLRMVLAKKAILVEGASDELIIQKAYKDKFGCLPIENGIDIISVQSLAFKRFLDIAKLYGNCVVVVTDNDGDVDNLSNKYQDYTEKNIKICYCSDPTLYTLEPCMLQTNGLNVMNRILEKNYKTDDDMIKFMIKNKVECALKIFETGEAVTFPQYILDAIGE